MPGKPGGRIQVQTEVRDAHFAKGLKKSAANRISEVAG